MVVAWIGGFDADRLRARPEGDVDDFRQRQVVSVRSLVVAPADMQPHAVGRQTSRRSIERFDVALGDLTELVVAQVPVLIVARRGEVGRIDLQDEAGFNDRSILGLDHVRERRHVGVLGRIVQVDDEPRQDAGRGRGHEHVNGVGLARGRLQAGEIAVERAAILVA